MSLNKNGSDAGRYRHYQALRLKPGATAVEIKDAYHKMAKVWHPDRFVKKPHLIQKAQQRMRELNEAHEYLLKNPHHPDQNQSNYQYQPRHRNYAAGTSVSTIRLKLKPKKTKFNWDRAKKIVLFILVTFILFSRAAAPLRSAVIEFFKFKSSTTAVQSASAKEAPRAPRRPNPVPASPQPPQVNQQGAPKNSTGYIGAAPGQKKFSMNRHRRMKHPPPPPR